jgi:hypothetical protein
VLDLRTYKLVPGGGTEFDRIFRERALPMLRRQRIDVVGHGPSLEDGDVYYMMRAFPSAAVRDEQLRAFYGSAEWRDNHREGVLALIQHLSVCGEIGGIWFGDALSCPSPKGGTVDDTQS